MAQKMGKFNELGLRITIDTNLNTIKFLQVIHSLKTILKANQLENYFSHRKIYLDTRRGGNSLVERFGEYSG